MKDDMRYVVGGASVGAMLGAIVGWLYLRSRKKQADKPLDSRQLMRLGGAIIGVIRQIVDLGY